MKDARGIASEVRTIWQGGASYILSYLALSPITFPVGCGLQQGLDGDTAAVPGLHSQFKAVEQGHADERINVRCVHGNATCLTVPDDYRLMDVKKTFAPVCKQRASTPAPNKTKCCNQWRRQG